MCCMTMSSGSNSQHNIREPPFPEMVNGDQAAEEEEEEEEEDKEAEEDGEDGKCILVPVRDLLIKNVVHMARITSPRPED